MLIDSSYVLFFGIVFVFMLNINLNAQWINDPSYNKKLILDCVNPTNITVSSDENGGAFIAWNDKKSNAFTNSLIQYITAEGTTGFRADGKKLSSLESANILPTLSNQFESSVVVCWLEQYDDDKTALKVQRVKQNGFFLWDENGLQITDGANEIKEFKVITDAFGTSYIIFTEKDLTTKKYFLKLQKLSPSGYIEYSYKGLTLASSDELIAAPKIFHSEKNGNYIFWNEESMNKTIVNFTFIPIDEFDPSSIARKKIFDLNSNLLITQIFQTAKSQFSILIHDRNKTKKFFSYKVENNSVIKDDFLSDFFNSKQNPTNIQIHDAENQSAFLVWVEEKTKTKNIFIDLIHLSGRTIWNQELQLNPTDEEQISYAAFVDKSNELKISWLQKPQRMRGALYSQSVNTRGELIYGSQPLLTAAFNESEKSYLHNYTDSQNGIIIIFKEKKENEAAIYGHRIYSPSELSISDFRCTQVDDAVNISFVNKSPKKNFTYDIHRGSLENHRDTSWRNIKTFTTNTATNNFEFIDVLDSSGNYFYRIKQNDEKKQSVFSATIPVSFFINDEPSFKLFENIPNPFFGETTISFYLPQPETVQLIIYNSKLETITDTTLNYDSKGKKNFSFRGYGLPPGVYYYRVVAGNNVEVKKMVMVK